ncbi:MAG: hypothetical protein J6S04_01485 [Clostridia bacterium]|nr:hypothetical protein [Clostridia bacterium]
MNKKVVFLVVLLECILAVFLVSVFGHAIEDSRRQILCQDIYFVTESGEKIEDGEMIEYKLTDANISYQLYWVMETEKTSNKEVVFESSDPMVKVNNLGLVTFLEETDVIITIRAIDGSGRTDSITLVPKRGGGIVDI